MLHVDVKKLGNVPDGGGWLHRPTARPEQRRATPSKPRSRSHEPLMDTAYVDTVLDDHSRVAYAEIHDDETAANAISFLPRVVNCFAARGV